jgi:hypothetical protein
MALPLIEGQLDTEKARELIDGFAPESAPYREHGKPSWFRSEAERRDYWLAEAPTVVAWAREHGFAYPRAALRYGMPAAGAEAMWAWGA